MLFADFLFPLCSLPFPHPSGEEAEEEGTIIFIIAEAPGLLRSGLIVNGHLGHSWIWIAGEETPKLQIPILKKKKILFFQQICTFCHFLLWRCRSKADLPFPREICLMSCHSSAAELLLLSVPFPWQLAPRSPTSNSFAVCTTCPAGLPLMGSSPVGQQNCSGFRPLQTRRTVSIFKTF